VTAVIIVIIMDIHDHTANHRAHFCVFDVSIDNQKAIDRTLKVEEDVLWGVFEQPTTNNQQLIPNR